MFNIFHWFYLFP